MKVVNLISLLTAAFLIQHVTLKAQSDPIKESLNVTGELTPISFGEQFTYYSKILDETRTVNIYLPEHYYESSEEHTYPVVLLNDRHGDQFFHTTAGIVRHLSSVDRIPESIVVSFHNAEGYAPNVYNNGMWGSQEMLEFDADPDLFIKHLTEEFFPYLESNFRAVDYRIIVGVSGSAIFPMHTFAKAPGLFQGHFILASADVVGMGYASGETFIDAFELALQDNSNLRGNLYFGVADGDLTWQEEYITNVDELKQRLDPYLTDNFKMKIDVIPNEDHYASYMKAMLAGFEIVFPKKKWSARYRDLVKQNGNALANIDAFYNNLSDEYGFRILPKADRWNNVNCYRFIGSRFLLEERTDEAIEVIQRWVKYRPKSAEALSQLAKGYKTNDQMELAISTQKAAITLARQYDLESVSKYEKQLIELNKK
ncbi:MAG: alpha/beta hydrolase-fold protein [Reichenbachiella sp.]|uniref:alpha/beta hydrolase-fold protein n=1 Tax=Reichenbachiella sp. TaxID=2184521 RepID=UPI003266114C